jgi:cation diffusion facilitator family transporter
MSEANPHGSTRAIFYALGANLGIAGAKGVAAWVTGSGSMLAESIHSMADCANQGLLFVGLARARQPVSREHPLGHGKAIYFWSFLVALMLFSMGGLFSVYEGIHKLAELRGTHVVAHPWVALGVLTVAIVLEGLSLSGALRESRKARRNRSLWQWFRTSRQAELLTVVGEDLAALLGLLLALVGIGLTMITGNPAFDALGSMAIGVLLLLVAVAVGVEVKSLLIGESADPEVEDEIRRFLSEHGAVAELLGLITFQLGPDLMVAVKARMAEEESVSRLLAEVNRCERELKAAFPQVRWSFFEPDR